MAFKEVTGGSNISSYWPAKAADRKVGDSVEGTYKTKMERTNPDGSKSVLYVLENVDGRVGVNASATITRAMEQIPEGSLVKIVFQGKQRSQKTGREYNNFQVFIDDATQTEPEDDGNQEVDLSGMAF